MGYAKNPGTVRKHAEQLAPLLLQRDYVWVNVDKPAKWAYKVRECLNIAADNPIEFPILSKVGQAFRDGKIRIAIFSHSVHVLYINEVAPGAVIRGIGLAETIAKERELKQLVNPTIPMVVDAWLQQIPSTEPIKLLECSFTNAELEQLENWAKGEGWEAVLEGTTVTVRPKL